MAKQVAIALSVSCSGDGISQYTYTPPPSPMVNSNAPEAVPQTVALASGANSIPVPATAQRCLLVPASNSNVTKNVKTTLGDVGLATVTDPVLFPLNGATTVYVQSGGVETISIVWG